MEMILPYGRDSNAVTARFYVGDGARLLALNAGLVGIAGPRGAATGVGLANS
jgi:hypothetical protein